jgi:putative transposase
MKSVVLLVVHVVVSLVKLAGPGGARGLLAETLLLKHQLLILNRGRKRAPNLSFWDRVFLGLGCLLIHPARIRKIGVVVSPATLFKFHAALVKRKYRRLFSSSTASKKPGPKGPSEAVIQAIIEMKQRNPRYGCPRIAQQIAKAFGIAIDKDIVRRVLAKHYRPISGGGGPSWLTFIGHMKDSLWSVDLFRCESILLSSHWVMVVMDQHTRRIIGFGVQVGAVDGLALCRMFNQAIAGTSPPRHLSTDNDPLFLFHRWKANLRVLEVDEIKTVPYVPLSHPFVERLIGTLRREYFDQVFFWNAIDLEGKLGKFKTYFNQERTHTALQGDTPTGRRDDIASTIASLDNYRWQQHCNGLFQLPIAA